jgi:hypothetical protein
MQEFRIHIRRTLAQLGLLAIFLCGGVYFAGYPIAVPGLLLGIAGSAIYFLLMSYRVRKAVELAPEKAIGYMRAGWLLRLSFLVLILILSSLVKEISFVATVIGLFSLHIVMFLNSVVTLVKWYLGKKV